MTRQEILNQAKECVLSDRNGNYGAPEDNFGTIARLWNAYLSEKRIIREHDVACMMALLKIARIAGGQYKEDSWVDLAGYAACGGELQSIEESLKTQGV